MNQYDADVEKAVAAAEHMRSGAPNNVLWLIVQALRWVGMLGAGANVKLDQLLKGGGGGTPCDLTPVTTQLDLANQRIVALANDQAEHLAAIESTEQQILEKLGAPAAGPKRFYIIAVSPPTARGK